MIQDILEEIVISNVLYQCTDRTVSRFATVVRMPAIMSLAVDDRRQVSSLFKHRDYDYDNYYLNKNFGYINSVE